MHVRLDIHPRGLSTCVIVIVMALADAAGPGPDRPVMIPVEKKRNSYTREEKLKVIRHYEDNGKDLY